MSAQEIVLFGNPRSPSEESQIDQIHITNYQNDYTYPEAPGHGYPSIDSLYINHNIRPSKLPWMNFDRYYSIYSQWEKDVEYQYVFVTRPQLNIVDEMAVRSIPKESEFAYESGRLPTPTLNAQAVRNPIIGMAATMHGEIVYNLIKSGYSHHFIPYFTERVSGIEVPDFDIKSYSISQPYTGFTMPFAGTGFESLTGGSLNLSFRDDAEHRIENTFRIWIEYMHCVAFGSMDPIVHDNQTFRNKGPIANHYFDYMCSIYTISTKADAREIVWYDKFTGCMPTQIPDRNHSFNRGGGNTETEISIPFQFFHHRACDPSILGDFNYNAFGGKNSLNWESSSRYLTPYHGTGNGMTGTPFIEIDNRYKKIYLSWKGEDNHNHRKSYILHPGSTRTSNYLYD